MKTDNYQKKILTKSMQSFCFIDARKNGQTIWNTLYIDYIPRYRMDSLRISILFCLTFDQNFYKNIDIRSRKDKDVLFTDETKKHILVIRKGHFFVFPVIDDKGNQFCKNH
jgi:hypothetical protein